MCKNMTTRPCPSQTPCKAPGAEFKVQGLETRVEMLCKGEALASVVVSGSCLLGSVLCQACREHAQDYLGHGAGERIKWSMARKHKKAETDHRDTHTHPHI